MKPPITQTGLALSMRQLIKQAQVTSSTPGNDAPANLPKDPTETSATVTPHPDGNDPKKLGAPADHTPVNKDVVSPPNPAEPKDTGEDVPTPASVGSPETKNIMEGVKSGSVEEMKIKAAAAVNGLAKLLGTKSASVQTEQPKPAEPAAPEAQTKSAGAAQDDFAALAGLPAGELLMKIGSVVTESERGVALVRELLEEKAGAEMADTLLKRASGLAGEQELLVKQAAAQTHQALMTQNYEACLAQSIAATLHAFSPADYDAVIKRAHVLMEVMSGCEDTDGQELVKIAAADAAALQAMLEQGGGQIPPEAMAAAGGGAEAPASPDEVAMIIQQLVQSGQIDEATGAQLMAMLEQAMAEEGGGGGGEPAPEEMEAMMKGASALVPEFAQFVTA